MVVTSTLMPGLAASKLLTASFWYWLSPDSVCWLSQNLSTMSSAEAEAGRAKPPRTVASATALRMHSSHALTIVVAALFRRRAGRRAEGPAARIFRLLVGERDASAGRGECETVRRQRAGIGD